MTYWSVVKLLSVLSIASSLATAPKAQAVELSGVLTLEDVVDSFRVDFSRLDTPTSFIGMRRDTVNTPDMILIHSYGLSPITFLIRTPYTPSLDSTPITISRFSESAFSSSIDSLRRQFLPIAASVNTECRQSGQCDTAGGGFFLRTSENGVVFWKPTGMYIGAIDRYQLFWAYSSDGTFGGGTRVQRNVEPNRAVARNRPVEDAYTVFDLQGKRAAAVAKNSAIDATRDRGLVIIRNNRTGQARTVIGFKR